ncbi:MAG: hypothetical protein HY079_05160 [Elusimicrobia bacterium]|nr:hypothetical protein [Elusimicrobiota bacterium]
MDELTPYEKAGRLFRLIAWLQLIAFLGILAAIAIPVFATGRMPPASSLLALLFFIFPAVYFKVGTAIKEHRDWGRTVGIIMGLVSLFGFPIGTLLGAYILWCLIKGWDEQPARPAAAPDADAAP